MPNLFAYIVLIAWPLISIVMFKKMQIIPATFWTIVGGYLLLPVKVAIDFPLIPPLDKESISAIAALVGCKFIKRKKIALIPKSGTERWLIIALLFTPLITVLNNQEPVFDGEILIPGLTLHDALSTIINQYIALIPFLLGLQLVKTHEDQLKIFKLLVIAGLWYSIPMLFEIRMSPQLHSWIYGFFPHSFLQQFRSGGFRPVVFMGHGLLTAMFAAITLGVATLLWKEKVKIYHFSTINIVVYFIVLLLLCKTLGALLLGVFLFLAIRWMPIEIMKLTILLIVFIVIAYPLLLIMELFPHQFLLDITLNFDAARAESLGFRFYHENKLLEHSKQKLLFGWGSWGRNRLSDSVSDGYWIIVFGQYGFIGFIMLFGLLLLGVWKSIKLCRFIKNRKYQHLLLSHTLIVSIIMADQLPNASIASWSWFFIGSLVGRANNVINKKNIMVQNN